MNRVSMKHLEQLADLINEMKGAPTEYAAKAKCVFKANVGYRYIYASGTGYSLACVSNESGGINTRFGSKTKRELFEKLHAYLEGLREEKE